MFLSRPFYLDIRSLGATVILIGFRWHSKTPISTSVESSGVGVAQREFVAKVSYEHRKFPEAFPPPPHRKSYHQNFWWHFPHNKLVWLKRPSSFEVLTSLRRPLDVVRGCFDKRDCFRKRKNNWCVEKNTNKIFDGPEKKDFYSGSPTMDIANRKKNPVVPFRSRSETLIVFVSTIHGLFLFPGLDVD